MPFSERKDDFAKQILSKAVLILFFCVLCAIPLSVASAATVTLAWDASTGLNIAGYTMYYGTASRNYTNSVRIGNVTNGSIPNLQEGRRYYFAVTARNSSNVESAYSTELPYTVPTATTTTGGSSSTLIIDNGKTGTKAVGTWTVSSSSGYYGTKSLNSKALSSTYTFTGSRSGSQKVYLWWTANSTRYSQVLVNIYNGSTLIKSLKVDQLKNGGKWNLLGTYSFSGQAKVVVVSKSSSKTTCADAVKFVSATSAESSGTSSISTSGTSSTGTTSGTSASGSTSSTGTTGSTSTTTPADTTGPLVDSALSGSVIIDNGDPATLASGTWKTSGGAGFYGSKSVFSATAGDTYSFEAPLSGLREVYLWWTEYSNRCENVDVAIYDGKTYLDTVKVNQKKDGGQWNELGTFSFSGKAKVTINSGGGCTTSADAVNFFEPH